MTRAEIRRRHRELGVAQRDFALLRQKILLATLIALALAALVRASGANTYPISIAINATNVAITVGVAADIPTV
jgi:predicted membrane-bound dolichyl-phosphate-mannose-protein mannosyltransferase